MSMNAAEAHSFIRGLPQELRLLVWERVKVHLTGQLRALRAEQNIIYEQIRFELESAADCSAEMDGYLDDTLEGESVWVELTEEEEADVQNRIDDHMEAEEMLRAELVAIEPLCVDLERCLQDVKRGLWRKSI